MRFLHTFQLADFLDTHYPVRKTRIVFRSNDAVEIAASLVSMAPEPAELDTIVAQLSGLAGIEHATSSVSALD